MSNPASRLSKLCYDANVILCHNPNSIHQSFKIFDTIVQILNTEYSIIPREDAFNTGTYIYDMFQSASPTLQASISKQDYYMLELYVTFILGVVSLYTNK